jgi:fatty acid desaturase
MPSPLAVEAPSSAAQVALPDAPAAQVPDDVRGFVRQGRLARPDSWRTAMHIAVVLGAWIGLAAIGLAVDSWPVWIVVWCALAVCTATPIALMHEAVHHNLFRSRLANHITGTIAAAWVFFHGPAYRAWHLTHHAFTFGPDDSEQLPERFGSKLAYVGYCAMLGPSFAVILWLGALGDLIGRPPRWIGGQRLQNYVRRWALAPALVLGLVVAAAFLWPAVIIKGWLVPAVLGSVVIFPFLTMPEHYEGKAHPDLLSNTRTTSSNRVMRYLYWNNNLHTAHHLVPTVPPHSLQRVDDQVIERNTLRDPGFFAFHRRVLRDMPWLPKRAADAAAVATTDNAVDIAVDIDLTDDTAATSALAPLPIVAPPSVCGSGVSMTISNCIDPALLPRLWQIYENAFLPLRELALLNHLYPRELFEDLVMDERVFKIIGWLDGQPVGLAAATNELDLVPQISPPFLHRRYPEHAARNAIYFGVFVCVDTDAGTKTVTPRLIAGMGQVAAVNDGVIICDVSDHNVGVGVDRMVSRIVDWFPNGRFGRIDSQHYFECVLPEPLERLPFSKAPMPDVVIDLRDTEPRRDAASSADSSTIDHSLPIVER